MRKPRKLKWRTLEMGKSPEEDLLITKEKVHSFAAFSYYNVQMVYAVVINETNDGDEYDGLLLVFDWDSDTVTDVLSHRGSSTVEDAKAACDKAYAEKDYRQVYRDMRD